MLCMTRHWGEPDASACRLIVARQTNLVVVLNSVVECFRSVREVDSLPAQMPQACPGDRYVRCYTPEAGAATGCHRLARWRFTLLARTTRRRSDERNNPRGESVAFRSVAIKRRGHYVLLPFFQCQRGSVTLCMTQHTSLLAATDRCALAPWFSHVALSSPT
jgi:hypothetical protein